MNVVRSLSVALSVASLSLFVPLAACSSDASGGGGSSSGGKSGSSGSGTGHSSDANEPDDSSEGSSSGGTSSGGSSSGGSSSGGSSSGSSKPSGATSTTCGTADDCGYWFCDCEEANGDVVPVNGRSCKNGYCMDAATTCPDSCAAFGDTWTGSAGGGPDQ
jgi:hypothetical protein